MSNKRERGASTSWESNDVIILCDVCIKEIQLGNRPTAHFNKVGWRNLIANFNARSSKVYDRAQLKNKCDQLKKDLMLWRELKRGETGLGWNPIEKTIDASSEWWNEKLLAIPAAKKFRNAGIPSELEEKLDIMFSSIVATGDDVWTPSFRVMPSNKLFEHNVSDDDDNMVTNTSTHGSRVVGVGGNASKQSHGESSTHQTKSSYSGTSEAISNNEAQLVSYVKDLLAAAHERAPPSRSSTIKEAFDELAKIPEIYDDLNFYNFATEFVLDKNKREGFMCCPADRKVWWLRTRYEKTLL